MYTQVASRVEERINPIEDGPFWGGSLTHGQKAATFLESVTNILQWWNLAWWNNDETQLHLT